MEYFLLRGNERYGPYTPDDVRAYVGAGNIVPDDLLEPAGGGPAIRTSALLQQDAGLGTPGFTPAPRPSEPSHPDLRQSTFPSHPQPAYAQPSYALPANIPPNVPPPPGMDWWLVLILSIFTCGLFGVVWSFVIANWVKKVNPGSRAMLYLVLMVVAIPLVFAAAVGGAILDGTGGGGALSVLSGGMILLVGLGASIVSIAAFLSISSSLAESTASWGGARIDLGGAFLAVVIVTCFINLLFFVAPAWIQFRLDEVRRLQISGGMRYP